MISILKYIASKISIGGFTNKDAWRKQPFAHLDSATLENHKKLIIDKMVTAGMEGFIIRLMNDAFIYFSKHPEQYDGASGDVELHKVGDFYYDISGVLHDYLDAINYTYTLKNLKLADLLLSKVMMQLGDPRVHHDKRVSLLRIVRPLRYLWSKERRISSERPRLATIIQIDSYAYGHVISYLPLYKYGAIAVVLLAIILSHPLLWMVIKLF